VASQGIFDTASRDTYFASLEQIPAAPGRKIQPSVAPGSSRSNLKNQLGGIAKTAYMTAFFLLW
jgi:hypothetical protein